MSPGKREGSAEEDAVANFREYLRIPSVQPDVKYGMLSRRLEVMISVDLLLKTKCERNLKGIFTCTCCFGEKEMTRSPSRVVRSNEC
jgi:hypothetical protein